jgi:hypothetical protein
MIDADVCIKDYAVFTDKVACWHRQRPAGVSIVTFEIDSEGEVNFSQIIRNGDDQAKLVSNDVALITENRY